MLSGRIGLWTQPVEDTQRAGQILCERLVKSNEVDWSAAMQLGGQVECKYAASVVAAAGVLQALDFE